MFHGIIIIEHYNLSLAPKDAPLVMQGIMKKGL